MTTRAPGARSTTCWRSPGRSGRAATCPSAPRERRKDGAPSSLRLSFEPHSSAPITRPATRNLDIHETEPLDEARFIDRVKQASCLPGGRPWTADEKTP
ncbi:MAG: hypothetical protein EOO70_01485 [Myxococcaceae bacterium]|nr:MAG: hypothetical protein EOO70_01485 [Myxococcaceae bacterium]